MPKSSNFSLTNTRTCLPNSRSWLRLKRSNQASARGGSIIRLKGTTLLYPEAHLGVNILSSVEDSQVQPFIARWKNSGAAERANYQLFLSELCDVLGVTRPNPTTPDDAENAYVFERSVTFHHPDGSTSTGRIDLYKRGCFVLEAKQGVEQ